jgi:Acetylornithine deacetylase/Succinyl-diaminopimelate desuccinylase and related deacylases
MTKTQIINFLSDFVKIQSVSTDKNLFSEIEKAVSFLKNFLLILGFSVKILEKEKAPPLILATLIKDEKAKTIGIYGHYDVQPEDPVSEWETAPFLLTEKKGKFFGRGVADNKGHIVQNLFAIKRLIEEKKLKNNIVFILEGEEETGSINFEDYVKEAKDFLSKVDVFYLTDTGMHQKNVPQIFYGLRGIIYFELTVKIGERDLHSGVYGNRVYNPINVLADLIAKIKDTKTGKILMPKFYEKVRKIEKDELLLLKKTLKSDEEEKKEASVFGLTEIDGFSSLSSKIFPSFDCHGIVSGFIGEGQKTVIPKEAKVKFSFRLVEHQDPKEIETQVFDFVEKNLPKEVRWELKCLSKSAPFYTDVKNKWVKKTAKILKDIFGNEVVLNRSGGSIPAAEILQRLYKKPIILTGFTLPDDNIHAPNENFDSEMFFLGIEALERIYE